jgi:tRNA wybutosine-synthesizing protein 3
MVYNFDNSKKVFLGKKDKSNKESWDKPIISLCKKINNLDNYFTTSSCSGRVVLIVEDEKKKPGLFLFRSHEKVGFSEFRRELIGVCEKSKEMGKMIFFKQEPCFIIVSCRDLKSQRKLFEKARNNGWKKSGIVTTDKKFILELMSTENISFPILDNGRLLVDDEFLRLVVRKANGNLERSWKKIKRLERLVGNL